MRCGAVTADAPSAAIAAVLGKISLIQVWAGLVVTFAVDIPLSGLVTIKDSFIWLPGRCTADPEDCARCLLESRGALRLASEHLGPPSSRARVVAKFSNDQKLHKQIRQLSKAEL